MTSRERREWYLSHGICPACGQNDVQRGYKLCLECRMKKKEYDAVHPATPEQLAAQRTRDHARRAERKAQGLCPRCGKHKPESGYAKCVYCRAKDAAQHRRKHAAQEGAVTTEQRGSGWYCWQCLAELPEWRENKLCDSCLAVLRERAAYMRSFIDYHAHTFRQEAHSDVQRIAKWRADHDKP